MDDLIDKACEAIDELIRLELEKHALQRQMKRSLRLCQLMGWRPKEMPKPVSTSVVPGKSIHTPWSGADLIIRVDGETTRAVPLKDVHLDLWPDDLRKQFEAWQQRQQRKKLMHAEIAARKF